MYFWFKKIFAVSIALLIFWSCSRVPDYVIDPDDMAGIMADINRTESYIEMNYSEFTNDSIRMAYKQSILAKYGYTLADLDTSYMWYGAHLKEYDKVCEEAVRILEDRMSDAGSISAGSATVAVAGDSVDLWSGARGFAISSMSPTPMTTFSLKADKNWKSGDMYTWRAKLLNNRRGGSFTIVADYTDGTTEYLTSHFGGDGWQSLNFFVDSTRTAQRIFGVLRLDTDPGTAVYLDSVQLVRNRLDPTMYPQRYRQRTIAQQVGKQ